MLHSEKSRDCILIQNGPGAYCVLPDFCSHDFWCSPELCWANPCTLTLSRNRRYPQHPHNIQACISHPHEGARRITSPGKMSDYLPSFLPNKGKTSILVWRPFTLPPHSLSSMPQITEPRVPRCTWCDAHTEPHLHQSCLESSQIITSTSGIFSIIHILLENKILQIQNILHNLLFPSDEVEQYIFHLPRLVRSSEQLKPSVNKASGYIPYCKWPQRTRYNGIGFGKI